MNPLAANFSSPTSWRYFRNTWIGAMVATILLASSCVSIRPALADEAPSGPPIIVFLVWTDAHGVIESSEFAGTTRTPQTCHDVKASDVSAHVDDWKDMRAKGYIPHLACAIAVPDAVFNGAPAKAPDVPSTPGNPDQPQHPSGGI